MRLHPKQDIAWMLSEEEGAMIYQGIQELLAVHCPSPQAAFREVFHDPSARAGLSAFLCRYATDTCYCLTGGRNCPSCVRSHLIAQTLNHFHPFTLPDLLTFLFLINPDSRERVAKFLTWSMKHPKLILQVKETSCEISLKEWGYLFQAVTGGLKKYGAKLELVWDFFCKYEQFRKCAMTGIVQQTIRMHTSLTHTHAHMCCFLKELFPHLIANTESLKQCDLILILLHIDRAFCKRVVDYVMRRGTFYCWNNGSECQHASIQLDSFSYPAAEESF